MELIQENELMRSLSDYIDQVEYQKAAPQEGDAFSIVFNEELALKTNIVAVDDNKLFIGLDEQAYAILSQAGMIKE